MPLYHVHEICTYPEQNFLIKVVKSLSFRSVGLVIVNFPLTVDCVSISKELVHNSLTIGNSDCLVVNRILREDQLIGGRSTVGSNDDVLI